MSRIRTEDEKRRNAESARRSAAKYPERRKAARQAYYQKNREELLAKRKAWRADGRGRKVQLRHSLAKLGWSLEAFESAKIAQGGRCDICGETPNSALHADHDHATMRPRALLCGNCNRALGLFKDSPERLERAANYLRRFL